MITVKSSVWYYFSYTLSESLNVYKSAEYGNMSLLKLLLWQDFSLKVQDSLL